ncbi:hypothetical protein [Herbidospora sp. RD11066]
MTTVEVRLSTPTRLPEALGLPVDAIGIGQEGCLTKLPDTDALLDAFAAIRATGRDAVLVSPIAWPRTAGTLVARVRAVAEGGPLTVVVNDLGTLLTLAGDRPAGCRLVVGLGLTRARPHSGDLSASAPPGAVVDTALLDELAGHGIDGVEVDVLTDVSSVDGGWQVRQVVDAVPVAYARSCPTARHHRTGPPDCRELCETSYTITPRQRWRLDHGHLEPLPAGAAGPRLTVWGNAVYQSSDVSPHADHLIIDARRHAAGELAARIAAAA